MAGPYGSAVLDDFTRANSTGLSNASWSTDYDAAGRASFDIASNTAKAAAGGFSSNWWNAATFGPNVEVFATLVTFPTVQAARLQLLMSGPGTAGVDGYELNIPFDDPGFLYLVRLDNAVRTDIDNVPGLTLSSGDSFALAVNAGNVEGWHKIGAGAWTKVVEVADATYAGAANPAISAQNDTAVAWDDFGAGTIAAAPTDTQTRRYQIRRSRMTSW